MICSNQIDPQIAEPGSTPTLPPHPSGDGTGPRCQLCGQRHRRPFTTPPRGAPHPTALACSHCDTPCPTGKKGGCPMCIAVEEKEYPIVEAGS